MGLEANGVAVEPGRERPGWPELGACVPRSGNAFSVALGRLGLRLLGFDLEGQVPNIPKCVLAVAPHTSNWDFPVGLCAKLALALRVNWLGKHTIFRFPFGLLWRRMGGIPVDRRAPAGVVRSVVAQFAAREQLFLGVAPEGTRRRVETWKSGFYRIALAAGVPIVLVALDYRRRRLSFGPALEPSGDYEADLAVMRARFNREMAYRPENY